MRSLLPPPARTARRRLAFLAVSLLQLATACDWITGVPSVDRVEVSDLGFIERSGSKALTYERLHDAGLALAATIPVRGLPGGVRGLRAAFRVSGG